MPKLKLVFAQCFLLSLSCLFAQNPLDSVMFEYGKKFWGGKDHIFVKGRQCENYDAKLEALFEGWKKNANIIVKYEDQIDSTDLTKHLNFFGTIKSYKYLNNYLPHAVKITKTGFRFGGMDYCDSLDAISIISSGGDRRFQLGNSFEGAMTLWTTFQDISQYMIMQDYAITRHGFLYKNEYNYSTDYKADSLRERLLKKRETKYYTFFYDPGIFSWKQNADSLFSLEDGKLENVMNTLHFDKPKRKIECCLYKDLEQKYYMSATPGFGNPFPLAFQNHSVGFGPVEHESIHILMGNVSTFFSEGIVGYYYCQKDSLEWKKNKYIISAKPDFSALEILKKSNGFDFSGFSYAVSAHFAKFLIDTYGLEKYKSAGRFVDIKDALMNVYNKSIEEISDEWNKYFALNKTILGDEREITFKVIAPGVPDWSSIYLTGDNERLGRWNPNSIKMEKQADGSWITRVSFPEGAILNYKFTRGNWESEALDDNGNIPANSILEVRGGSSVMITICKWKDQLKKE